MLRRFLSPGRKSHSLSLLGNVLAAVLRLKDSKQGPGLRRRKRICRSPLPTWLYTERTFTGSIFGVMAEKGVVGWRGFCTRALFSLFPRHT